MNIYEFNALNKNYASYAASEEAFMSRVFSTNGQSKFADWSDNIEIQFNDDSFNKDKGIPDIGYLTVGSIILSAKALKCLGSYLSDFGEFLPLNFNGEKCYLYNVTNLVDCAFNDGDDLLAALAAPKFITEKLPKEDSVFKIPPRKSVQLYVSGNSLQKLISDNNLTGGVFKQLNE
jgi:hypothetical protein